MSGRLWLALAFVAVSAVPAFADDKAECDYLEITASAGKEPAMDAEVKPLAKKFKKPPFSAWNTFHTLSSGHVSLQKLKAETPKLKQGSASLLLRDRTEKGFQLTTSIDGADGKRKIDNTQTANVGEWLVFVDNVGDNGHIVALTCK